MTWEEGQRSPECMQPNQIFPKKPPVLEEESLQVPFPELHGESAEYVGRAEDAIIAISRYRLHIKFKESIVNVPLQLIESVECRDIFQLHIICKDCKVIRCQFSTFEQCQEWLKRLTAATQPLSRLEELFSFAFHAWCVDMYAGEKEQRGELCRPGEHVISRFKNEVERMGFDTQNVWRISEINTKYRLCSSYPQLLLVPAWITDKELENVSAFRSWKRFPAVVYRHQSTAAVIARCGQPEVSWWGWRNADDEHLVQSIAKACAMDSSFRKHLANGSCSRDYANGGDFSSDGDFDASMTNSSEVETLAIQPPKLLILDARSYAAAVANRAKGGGCECPEYYPNCEVVFMGMANIHSIRKSFQSLRLLCTQMPDPANWLSALEGTRWLQHLSLLLKAALLVVNAVDRDHRPVLVHCSDGWDRTPQIVALSKLLLDPYYRTVEGFQVLVETEWLDFGHKFADRCGHGENSVDPNERCPVFLQWLDCVHQLQRQFPCSFEFSEAFLVKLVQHTYSCLFGTFLCNSSKERDEHRIQERTCSVWSLLRPANRGFRNMLYSSHSETVLHPVCHVRNLMLWTAVYLPSSSPTTPSDDSCAPYPEDPPLGRLPKTRSFDNLTSACDVGGSLAPNRRSSDPSLNEKWQDHRRSLELNIGVGSEGGGAELSVAAGVPEAQMENILQEATEEESGTEICNNDASRESPPPEGGSVTPPNIPQGCPATLPPPTGLLVKAATPTGDKALEAEDGGEQKDSTPKLTNGHAQVLCTRELEKLQAGVEQLEDRASLMASSTETLTEDGAARLDGQRQLPLFEAKCPPPYLRKKESVKAEAERGPTRTLNGAESPSHSALQSPKAEPLCNGVTSFDMEPRVNGDRAPLSRQVSAASCGSLPPHPRGGRCPHTPLMGRAPASPEQSMRSHLDEDGLAVPVDVVQQRLRQIEAGHRLEVETLKRQVQELRSRLESQQLGGSGSGGRLNGDVGDEVVTRWYPDHLAAQCYGCESRFWLATRRHHCRNCGNVFCATCCNQKMPVPSQQLFEPSRVCKACYGNLQLLELEKPITASSN
uniref:phosphatidylinositol-3,5-bisphosphate 3-phosphatase n=1 Tax=Paramormyrops kingsleyae TaxID=1676925 RepID=A0A3B3QUG8_9TELE